MAAASRPSISPGPTETVTPDHDPRRTALNDGRTSDAAPNGAHTSSVAGRCPVNPSPPSRIGPASGTSPADPVTTADASSSRQAAPAATNRSSPAASMDQARPIPTIARSASGWIHNEASSPSVRAARNRSIGSGMAVLNVADMSDGRFVRRPACARAATSPAAIPRPSLGRHALARDGHDSRAGGCAIRASSTPTLRSSRARSVG